ncbi:phospholipase D-like domain-containing protein [Simkania sp.]|uniref:phospholipase D-like domain-containing protein n=1 Tax=Simkania sp. TaxID=34094 RepID=UPI003B51B077
MLSSSALRAKKSRFFLLAVGAAALVFYATYFPLPTGKTPVRFYSTHLQQDLRLVVLKALKSAKSSIHIYTYALTDPHVLSILMEKAKEGLDVHVTYHQKNTPKLETLSHLHLHPEKGRGLMHAKWIVIDEKVAFLGTANLTSSSLMMHENLLAGFYAPEFSKALVSPSFFQGAVGNSELTFYLLPDPKALPHLLEVLDQAKKKIHIAMFTFTHPQIVSKLIELHQQGIKVEVSLDQMGVRGASKKVAEALQAAGVPVHTFQGMPLFHHKWALIDESTLVLGSANWTRAAFNKNKDFILFITNTNKNNLKSVVNIIKKDSLNCN